MNYKPIQPRNKFLFTAVIALCVLALFLIAVLLYTYVVHEKATRIPSEFEFSGRGGADIAIPITKEDADMSAVRQEESTVQTDLFYTVYQVKKGDMIGVLAEEYGVTQDTLISLNKIKNTRTIQIGQYIKIPSMSGILYTAKDDSETVDSIAEKYSISAEKILAANEMASSAALSAGETLFLPEAQLDWVTRQEINGDLFKRPLSGSYYISDYFGSRYNPFTGVRSYHTGIDMATSQGSRINAALGGTVVFAGWDPNGVFGNYVKISHHSGYQTLYGHMSSISVRVGQYVEQGQKVGAVGNTGQSTGPHLHFSVYKRGALLNPASLWN